MKKTTTEKGEVKRGRGRPFTNKPTKKNLLVIRLEDMEIEELKILQRDTKADTMTALIRNFISVGAYVLANKNMAQPENEIYYKRFFTKWDPFAHLSMYSDKMGTERKAKLKAQKNVNKPK